MQRNCPSITSKGEPCRGYVHPGHQFCPAHDPARAEARKRIASKAARSRTGGEIAEVKAELRQLSKDVRECVVTPGVGSVTAQILGVFLKACEVEVRERDVAVRERELAEIKLPEFRELQGEVRELKELLDEKESRDRRGGSSWAG